MQVDGRKRPRILTFNHHESFLSSMAGVNATFDVVTKYKDLDLSWNVSSQPTPENFRLIEFNDAVEASLDRGSYDFIVCHTLKNLLWLWKWKTIPFVFVAHIPLFQHTLALRLKSFLKRSIYQFFAKTHRCRFVAVSEFKRKSWDIAGDVVVLAPKRVGTLHSEDGYGEILVVCNELMNRQEELGAEDIFSLAKELPIKMIGRNPGVNFSMKPKDYQEFRELFTKGRIYLYTIRQPYGDGYNTAMLEAMAMGMAIITVDNPSSPIQHQINGLVAKNLDELKQHCTFLLKNPEEVDRLGKKAQETIAQKFSETDFLTKWSNILSK